MRGLRGPLIGPALCRETPASRTANVGFSSQEVLSLFYLTFFIFFFIIVLLSLFYCLFFNFYYIVYLFFIIVLLSLFFIICLLFFIEWVSVHLFYQHMNRNHSNEYVEVISFYYFFKVILKTWFQFNKPVVSINHFIPKTDTDLKK